MPENSAVSDAGQQAMAGARASFRAFPRVAKVQQSDAGGAALSLRQAAEKCRVTLGNAQSLLKRAPSHATFARG